MKNRNRGCFYNQETTFLLHNTKLKGDVLYLLCFTIIQELYRQWF